jgi:hypothetical protein
MRVSNRKRSVALAVTPLAALAVTAAAAVTTAGPATAAPAKAKAAVAPYSCPPSAIPLGFSDALDKLAPGGTTIGGLSSIAYDRQSQSYVSAVDNNADDPSRLWFYKDLTHPHIVGAPLVLRRPDGTPYNGQTADNEGLAVLPDGRYLVSSETEPSIRVFSRSGVQRASLPVPARFAVAPAGEATANATLEGLSISPSGRYVYASMEGTLSGDAPASGEARWRRILVYRASGSSFRLVKQVGYEVDPGMRIADAAAYDDGSVVVLEAAYDPAIGNTIRLYAVTGADRAPDITKVANLSQAPARDVLRKRLVSDVTKCPSLGATAKETQTNPLMDNFEGLYVNAYRPTGIASVTLISDDNFSTTQTTRVLNLLARLP